MKLEDYHNIYFLGIGGIGMSALGRWFLKKGLNVSGYDRTSTTLTNDLQKEGMAIHFEDSVDNIPQVVRQQKEKTLVIFTPAIPKNHLEYNYLKDNGYTIVKAFGSTWLDNQRIQNRCRGRHAWKDDDIIHGGPYPKGWWKKYGWIFRRYHNEL